MLEQRRRNVRLNRSLCLVDDGAKTYTFLERSPSCKDLPQKNNKENTQRMDGYTRISGNGKKKVFKYRAT